VETYRVKLQLNGSFITPFQADTIFGGLCWAVRHSEGEDSIRAMLEDFRCGRPWFVLSNAYPGDLLPKPLLKVKRLKPETRDGQLLQAREGKRLKKINYLTLEEFRNLVSGRSGTIESKEKPVFQVASLHNQVNRVCGSTVEGGQLFEQLENYINPLYNYLSVYIKLKDPGLREWLLGLFRLLGQIGLGKRKSTGKGSFTVISMEKYDMFEDVTEPNAYLSLSNFIPAPGDPIDGNYKIFVKYGKLGEEYALSEIPYKRPLLMLLAGSVFWVNNEVKPFYGLMIENIAPAHPEVLQYALAFSVPVRWEG